MTILGHGVDIVEVARIDRIRREHGERFLERCFTPAEREYAAARKRGSESLAGRFAAKEAVLKALGTGWRDGIAWTDVEVVVIPSGQPEVRLCGVAAQTARKLGITGWLLSLSHTEAYAVASAIAVGGEN
jgi:holo-[acyl-carrier protein] synthase